MAQVCWLGGNLEQRKLVLNKIKDQFSGFDMQVFSGDESFAFLEQEICTSSCFSEKRLIIIEALPDMGKNRQTTLNRFKKRLETLPDDVFIVFYGIEAKDEKALFNHVEKIGKVYDFPSVLDTREATQWVVSRFYASDKVISQDDADFLIRTSGYDRGCKGIGIDVLTMAIDKICLYVGNRRKNITRDDLVNTAFESQEFNVWALNNAFDSKNLEKCYEAIEKIKSEHEHLHNAVESIFAICLWRYKMLFYIKEEQARRPRNSLVEYFTSLPKLIQSGHGWKMKMIPDVDKEGNAKMMYTQFSAKEAIEGQFGRKPILSHYSRKELRRILEVLEEGMREVRVHTDGGLLLLLDTLVFAVCNLTDDAELLKTMRMSYG